MDPSQWIVERLGSGRMIIAQGDGFGDYVLTRGEFATLRGIVLSRDNYKCVYCGDAANTIDHVFPKVQGGLTVEDNLVAACRSCNSQKGGRL